MIYTGIRFNETAGEAIPAFTVVRPYGGEFFHADGTDATHQKQIVGITFNATASGAACYARRLGTMVNSDWDWTPGAPLYFDEDGALTETPPGDNCPQVAIANTATEIFVDIRTRGTSGDNPDAHVHTVEQFTLNSTDVSNKYVLLALTPLLALGVTLEVLGAPALVPGVDFEMDESNPKKVKWSGLGLDGLLASGDKLVARYFRTPS